MDFSISYTGLGDHFYEKINPAPVEEPRLFLWNNKLDGELLISEKLNLTTDGLAQIFSGNTRLPGSEPIAIAYAGHQFGNFVPQLGDGRAHLIGEVVDQNGLRKDIQLKGSGQTSFSRNGDGRCALGPAIREFVMSEAMHAMGIPTTRCLSVTTTGESVYRETPQPGAVVTRIASSHLRVGTFEYFAARNNYQAINKLCDFAIDRHYPALRDAGPDRFKLFLEKVIEQQVKLVVDWLRVGFIHGVMNTDNTTISGETIDFGPCAMMGTYNPKTVFSSIDRHGRYAFGNQPTIAQWNMARFAETLLPLIDQDETQAIETASSLVNDFSKHFEQQYFQMMSRKIGLSQPHPSDHELITELLNQMETRQLDYTISFNQLTESLSSQVAENQIGAELDAWYINWKERLGQQPETVPEAQALMRQANPVVIPRNHHMEGVIQACIETGEASYTEDFIAALSSPYRVTEKTAQFQDAPADADSGYQTFCGT